MSKPTTPPPQNSRWADEETAKFLRLRIKTFYNLDYFERIVLPLLDIRPAGRVLDVGCGYGGLALLLARRRPDLQITGVDAEASALDSAARTAAQDELPNVAFEQGDAHQLRYAAQQFDAVVCQTVLTHVRAAEAVVGEMARVLKPSGVFMAAEYTNAGAWTNYNNVGTSKRDEAWHHEFFRVMRLFMRGKKALGRGDEQVGVRVPLLATAAGLQVFDLRLNDRALLVIPPYRHAKEADYLELLEAAYAPDPDRKGLAYNLETIIAGGGTEEDANWLYNAEDNSAVRQAIAAGTFTMTAAYMLYLTFARKPVA